MARPPDRRPRRAPHASGNEFGIVTKGQEGGDWKTVTAGQSYYVPANIVHETKNVGSEGAKAVKAFVLDKGKPRTTPAS